MANMKTKTIKWIKEHGTILVIIFCLCAILFPYLWIFGKNGLSKQVDDWAAFGTYMSGTVAIISTWLVYKTYRDQSIANKRGLFENSLCQKTDSIKKRLKEYNKDIKILCEDLLNPFKPISTTMPPKGCTNKCYELALKRIFDYNIMNRNQNYKAIQKRYKINNEFVEEMEDLIPYIGETFSYIREFPLIDKKGIYVSDMKSLLSEELKVVMFFYVISKPDNTLFHIFKEVGVFKWRNIENLLFQRIVELICKERNLSSVPCFDYNSMIPDDSKNELVESNNFLEIVANINMIENNK